MFFFKTDKPASEKKKRKKWKLITISAIAVLVIGGVFVIFKPFSKKETVAAARTARVERGTVTKTIEGSGTIEAINRYEVTALVKGEIIADYFEEGQILQKGDLMYEIDSSDLDSTIKKSTNSIEKSRISYNDSLKNLNDLTVTATTSGVIKTMYVENDDTVSNGAKIADIINSDTMLLKINFLAEQAKNIYTGQRATVELVGSFSPLEGTVSKVAAGSVINDFGVPVTPVEITVANPGGIMAGDTATAIIGDYSCNSPGTFQYYREVTVVSKASGTVKNLKYSEGDYIENGAVLLNLENSSLISSINQSALSLKDSELALQNYYDQLKDYKITAPISGKVIQKNSKAGEKIDSSNSTTTMAIIADLSAYVFYISVDELDITGIKEGQAVKVTADALEGEIFSGVVDNVSIVGTSNNGVTSYPVKVLITDVENTSLIPGMNVDAEIVIESRENVLRLPASAINRGNTVTLAHSGSAGEKNAEQNRVRVETGLNDGRYVEIISGLNEGDEVVVPEIVSSSSAFDPRMMGGMMGGGNAGFRIQSGGASAGGRIQGGSTPAGGRIQGGGSSGAAGRTSGGRTSMNRGG